MRFTVQQFNRAIKERTVSFIYNRLSPNVLLALLTAPLLVVLSAKSHAQTTRNFQVSLWECCLSTDPRVTYGVNTDVREFGYSAAQPAGVPSVLVINGNPLPSITLDQTTVSDWSQIVALEVDEPYTPIDGDLFTGICTTPTDPNLATINQHLSAWEAQLKIKNSKARFWVNLTLNEANWIQSCYFQFGIVTLPVFNQTYFDVISTDWYGQHWVADTTIQAFYDVVAQNRATPHQQVALVPGVYSSGPFGSQQQYLQDYFTYANTSNQNCNLPLGPQGVTGIFDGCPVWLVMGYLSGSGDGHGSVGILMPASENIKAAWETEVAYTRVTPTEQDRENKNAPILLLLIR